MSEERSGIDKHAASNRVKCKRSEQQQVMDAVTADDVTIKNEPTDIFNRDIPRDTNTTIKHEEHDRQLPWYHVVVDSTVVKIEPAADDVYSLEVVDSTSGAATTIKQKNEPSDIFNSDIPRYSNISVKNEEHDLQLPCDHEVVDSIVVKSEPADVDDVYSSVVVGIAGPTDDASTSGAATTVKQDVLRPCKPEQEEEYILGTRYETEENPSSDKQQLGTDTDQDSTYNAHMITHTVARPHKCDVCFKSFRRKSHVKSHMLTHTGDRPHKCDVCFKSFRIKQHLKTHMMTHTGNRPYKCDACFKTFQMKSHIKKHMLTHTVDLPHKCDVCFKSFGSESHVKAHMLTHTGDRPHKCEICFKNFRVRQHLETHMTIHTGNRPYKCDACFKSFQRKSHVKEHMLTHTVNLPHKCDVCFKSFRVKKYLKSHMLTHTDNRTHNCDICLKSFRLKSHVKAHMLTHTGDLQHKCDVCFKSFRVKKYLKAHMLTHR